MSTHSEFSYRAVDRLGNEHKGLLRSNSAAGVVIQLTSQNLTPIEVEVSGAQPQLLNPLPRQARRALSIGRRRKAANLLEVTETTAALLGAGLTVDRALQIQRGMAADAPTLRLIEGLQSEVRSGQSMHQAFRVQSTDVPSFYLGMLEAGEVAGALSQTMKRLGELMRHNKEVRERLITTLIYPLVLISAILLTLLVLFTFVLPRFEVLFSTADVALPMSTKVVLEVGKVVNAYWPWMLVASIVAVAWVIVFVTSQRGRARIQSALVHWKVFYGVPLEIEMARVFRTLAVMLQGGVGVVQGLRICQKGTRNHVIEAMVNDAMLRVQQGEALSVALANQNRMPGVGVQLCRVGEEAGDVGSMLTTAADILEERTRRRLEMGLALLLPCITVTLGLFVAAVMGAVLLGLLSLNDIAA